MSTNFFLALIAFLFVSGVTCQTEIAIAVLQGTNNAPGASGLAVIFRNGTDYYVNLTLSNVLTQSSVSIHVHEFGDISDSAASLSTGNHFNPQNVSHGCPGVNATLHRGDLGAVLTLTAGNLPETTLGPFSHPLLSGVDSYVGHAFVVHRDVDTCANPLGAAGPRLLHGVLGIANRDGNTAGKNDVSIVRAVCELKGTAGYESISGRVFFTPSGNNLVVEAFINNITGTHGIHVHEFGDLTSTNGLSAGNHWNPTNSPHGIPPNSVRHYGDMGNVYHYVSGVAYYKYPNELLKLSGTNNLIGRAVVLHQYIDNCGQPVGNAGARYATCVIGVANPATINTVPVDTPAGQNSVNCTSPLATTEASSSGSFIYVSFFVLAFASVMLFF